MVTLNTLSEYLELFEFTWNVLSGYLERFEWLPGTFRVVTWNVSSGCLGVLSGYLKRFEWLPGTF